MCCTGSRRATSRSSRADGLPTRHGRRRGRRAALDHRIHLLLGHRQPEQQLLVGDPLPEPGARSLQVDRLEVAQLLDAGPRQHPVGDVRIDRRRRLAVVSEEIADRLDRDVRPALRVDHVAECLGGDHLRDRCDDDRVPHLRSHAADLLEHRVEQLGAMLLLEHPPRRRDHAAGELVVVVGGVELLGHADRQIPLGRQPSEVVCHLRERLEVEPVREAGCDEVPYRRLGGRVRRAAGERARGGVEHAEAGPCAFEVDDRSEADRGVAVQLGDALAGRSDEVGRQLAHCVGREQPAGVLEVEAIHVGAVRERRRALRVVRMGVDGADRVGEADHHLLDSLLLRHARDPAQSRGIVRRVGDLEAPDPVAHDASEGEAHQVLVARHPRDEAHPGRDVAERRVRHPLADEPEPLPRVLPVKADRDGHVRARGEVGRVEADAVDRGRDRDDVRRGQPGCAPEALIAVARGRVDDVDHRPFAVFTPRRGGRPARPRVRLARRRA